MRVEKDFEDILRLFNKHKVKYCIVGAFAVGFHGYPRYTKDIDILLAVDPANAKKVIKAIREFGLASTDLSEEDFNQENKVIQLGYEPVRIDFLTSIKDVEFADIWKSKKTGFYGKEKVFFMGLDELIKSKRSAHRSQDIVDIEKLMRRQR